MISWVGCPSASEKYPFWFYMYHVGLRAPKTLRLSSVSSAYNMFTQNNCILYARSLHVFACYVLHRHTPLGGTLSYMRSRFTCTPDHVGRAHCRRRASYSPARWSPLVPSVALFPWEAAVRRFSRPEIDDFSYSRIRLESAITQA